jgi:hypothetical protein
MATTTEVGGVIVAILEKSQLIFWHLVHLHLLDSYSPSLVASFPDLQSLMPKIPLQRHQRQSLW